MKHWVSVVRSSIIDHRCSIGGGFEGDMLFPKGFDPVTAAKDKGVAISGPHPWPDNTVPYDLSYITCKNTLSPNHYRMESRLSS